MNKNETCKKIQANICRLSDNEIIELFKIISETKTSYTRNNNGIFLNLNWVDDDTIQKLDNYMTFCIKSQNEICKYEMMKNMLNDSIKTKDKDAEDIIQADIVEVNTVTASKPKCSSSMKFYLLKKKFMKQNSLNTNIDDNELSYEDYIIT